MTKDPLFASSIKSAPLVVPALVQNNVVPLDIPEVIILYVTVPPSFTVDAFGVTWHVGTDVSVTDTVAAVATIGPTFDDVLKFITIDSTPSKDRSLVNVLVNVPRPLLIVTDP